MGCLRWKYLLVGAVLASTAALPHPASASVSQAFVETACKPELVKAGARCGSVQVPENRAAPEGRTIDLNIILIPATAGYPLPPLFDVDGGPGLPATKNADFYIGEGAAYRAGRDIVLIDQRGTGQSNGLHCPELAAPEAAHRPMLPVDGVVRCREQLRSRADLRHYGTTEAVADLDAVRAALGYNEIDFFALSYGTIVASRYMATYPEHVRAAVLLGVAPSTAMPPRFHAAAGERALDLLLEDCAADPECRAAFPQPRQDLRRAVEQLSRADDLDPKVFLERLRSLMYSAGGARRVPWIISRAAAGDLGPFYSATTPNAPSKIADGMFLSVTCSEALALMPFEDAVKAARATLFGDYRLRRQRAACGEWPTGQVPPDFLSPVRSDAAVLLISGYLDRVTPPQWAEEIRSGLPNSNHVVLRYSGHIVNGLSEIDTCFDRLVLEFFRTAKPKELDVSCTANMKPPAFKVR